MPSHLCRFLIAATFFCIATLLALPVRAAIAVQITQPQAASVQGGPLNVTATVTSTFQLQSVVANVDAASANLTFGAGSSWAGSVDLSSLATGDDTLVVTATDIYGTMGSSSIAFRYRHPPTVAIDEPVMFDVAGAMVRVRATCVDEKPSTCTITAGAVGLPVKAFEHLDAMLNLNPGWNRLYINVENDAGQGGGGYPLYVFSDPSLLGLRPIACAPGQILDFDATRLLYRRDLSSVAFADRGTGMATLALPNVNFQLMSDPRYPLRAAYLGSNSALVGFDPTLSGSQVVVDMWRAGATLPEVTYLATAFALNADRMAHIAVPTTNRVVLTHLTDGTDVDLPNAFALGPVVITPSGAALYQLSSGGGVVRWVDGNTTPLTGYGWQLVTADDTNAVVKNGSNGSYAIVSENAPDAGAPLDNAEGPWAVAGGWVAFSRLPDAGPPQVWTRSPAGQLSQVSFFGAGASAEAVSEDGEVAMTVDNGERWIGRAGSPPTQIDPFGTIRRMNGQWYEMVGRMLFRLSASCAADDPECGNGVDGGPFSACAMSGPADGGAETVDASLETGALDAPSADAGPVQDGSSDATMLDAGSDLATTDSGSSTSDATADHAPIHDASLNDASLADASAGMDSSPSSEPPPSAGCGGCRLPRQSNGGTRAALLVVALASLTRALRYRRPS